MWKIALSRLFSCAKLCDFHQVTWIALTCVIWTNCVVLCIVCFEWDFYQILLCIINCQFTKTMKPMNYELIHEGEPSQNPHKSWNSFWLAGAQCQDKIGDSYLLLSRNGGLFNVQEICDRKQVISTAKRCSQNQCLQRFPSDPIQSNPSHI